MIQKGLLEVNSFFETNREDIIENIKDSLGLNNNVPFSQMSSLLKQDNPLLAKTVMYKGYMIPEWLYKKIKAN